MNILTVLLSIILIWFQYDLWIGKNGVYELICIKNMIASYQDEDFISIIRERNDRLFNEIYDLKHGFDIIEEKSRNELGMIKIGETFYQFSKDEKLEYDCEKEY